MRQRLFGGRRCEPECKKPITGVFGLLPACCALAASGQDTAAPPRSVMNSRRLMCSPEIRRLHPTTQWQEIPRCASQQIWRPMSQLGQSRLGGGKLQVQQCPQCPVSDGRPETAPSWQGESSRRRSMQPYVRPHMMVSPSRANEGKP